MHCMRFKLITFGMFCDKDSLDKNCWSIRIVFSDCKIREVVTKQCKGNVLRCRQHVSSIRTASCVAANRPPYHLRNNAAALASLSFSLLDRCICLHEYLHPLSHFCISSFRFLFFVCGRALLCMHITRHRITPAQRQLTSSSLSLFLFITTLALSPCT